MQLLEARITISSCRSRQKVFSRVDGLFRPRQIPTSYISSAVRESHETSAPAIVHRKSMSLVLPEKMQPSFVVSWMLCLPTAVRHTRASARCYDGNTTTQEFPWILEAGFEVTDWCWSKAWFIGVLISRSRSRSINVSNSCHACNSHAYASIGVVKQIFPNAIGIFEKIKASQFCQNWERLQYLLPMHRKLQFWNTLVLKIRSSKTEPKLLSRQQCILK